jgi:hypothetical protein
VRGSILGITISGLVVGCGHVGTQPGDPCSAKERCSEGQICDMTDPDGPACLDGSGDLDGDGIPNAKDFCEHMPGGAFDEDGDGIGDECDACPIAPPPATPETDGDGVDFPCDPNPTMPGDKIVLFNGFNAALPPSWTASPAWQVRGGEAIMTPTDVTKAEELSAPLGAALTTHTVIFAAYRIDSVAAGATAADAAVIGINRLPMGSSTAECGGSRAGPSDFLRLQTDAGSGSKAFMNLFDPASLYRVVEQLDGGTANCAMVANSDSGAITTMISGNPMSSAGVFARGATARFAYILVVQR